MKLINIGFGNIVAVDKITSIVNPDSAPVKRLVQEAKDNKMVIDATFGRKTRAVIVTVSGQLILSAIQPETIASRIDKGILGEIERNKENKKKDKEDKVSQIGKLENGNIKE